MGRGVGAGDGSRKGGGNRGGNGDTGVGESAIAVARRDGVVRVFDGVGLLRGEVRVRGPVVGARSRSRSKSRVRYHASAKPSGRGQG